MNDMKNFKRLILLLTLLVTCFNSSANNGYLEWNFGAALIGDGDYDGWFPGTSFLIGSRYDFDNNLFLDGEIGLALPSIVTAKGGVGAYINKNNKSAISIGVRPYPMHAYAQINFPESKIGQWIFSAEIGNASSYSFYSNAILNCGYRWKLNRGKK